MYVEAKIKYFVEIIKIFKQLIIYHVNKIYSGI